MKKVEKVTYLETDKSLKKTVVVTSLKMRVGGEISTVIKQLNKKEESLLFPSRVGEDQNVKRARRLMKSGSLNCVFK